ncbi:MAG: serpin family protein [Oscillospiraceae bacterium]
MSENSEKIYEAVTNISDELVESADVKRRRPRRAWYVSAVAALLAVCIAVALFKPGGGALAIAEAAYHEYERLPDDITTPGGCFEALTAQFLSGAGEENAVLSPVNIYMALAMLAELTDGESRAQLLDLIGAQNIEAVREQAQAIWRACSMDVEEIQCVLASSIWLRDDLGFVQSTMDTLANTYYASSYRGEMGSGEINRAIQSWLNEQTRGLLEEQAAAIETDPLTVLLLATTIYYSAQWTGEFNEELNYTDVFHAPSGDVDTEYMYTGRFMDYYSGEGWGAVRLSLRGGNGMWFILPDEGVSVDALLEDDDVMRLMSAGEADEGEYVRVYFSVPKFDIATQLDLIEGLMELGVTDVFDSSVSDFTPMTTDAGEICVTTATHAARVKIDEEGVEAAAFTVLEPGDTAPMPPEREIYFTLDRPFLFAISSQDGLPLFAGVVNQPG